MSHCGEAHACHATRRTSDLRPRRWRGARTRHCPQWQRDRAHIGRSDVPVEAPPLPLPVPVRLPRPSVTEATRAWPASRPRLLRGRIPYMPVFLSTGGVTRVVGVDRTTGATIARFAELRFPTTNEEGAPQRLPHRERACAIRECGAEFASVRRCSPG